MREKGFIIIGCLLVLFFCTISTGCNSTPKNESGFNLIFKYGIGARNILDTYRGTFTKDMILDPSVTVKLILTEEELDGIYRKIAEIDFFNYPEEFSVALEPDPPVGLVTPYASYYFKVEHKGEVKELWWDDEIVWQNKWLRDSKDKIFFKNRDEAEKLYELISIIREIIENKPEYKELPEPTGGYM